MQKNNTARPPKTAIKVGAASRSTTAENISKSNIIKPHQIFKEIEECMLTYIVSYFSSN